MAYDQAALDALAKKYGYENWEAWRAADALKSLQIADAYGLDTAAPTPQKNIVYVGNKAYEVDAAGGRTPRPDLDVPANTTNVTVQTQPLTSKASMSEADIREQAQKNGGKVDERGGVIVVTWADGSQTRYDPTRTPPDGKVTYNPTYVPPPASSASKQTEFEKRMEALRRGSAPGSAAGTTPAEPIVPQELVGTAGDFQTKGNAGAADPSVREQYVGATAGEGTPFTQKAPIASALLATEWAPQGIDMNQYANRLNWQDRSPEGLAELMSHYAEAEASGLKGDAADAFIFRSE